MVCPHGQGEGWLSEHFADNGEGSIFRDFVRTSFMDGPLYICYMHHTQNKKSVISRMISQAKRFYAITLQSSDGYCIISKQKFFGFR